MSIHESSCIISSSFPCHALSFLLWIGRTFWHSYARTKVTCIHKQTSGPSFDFVQAVQYPVFAHHPPASIGKTLHLLPSCWFFDPLPPCNYGHLRFNDDWRGTTGSRSLQEAGCGASRIRWQWFCPSQTSAARWVIPPLKSPSFEAKNGLRERKWIQFECQLPQSLLRTSFFHGPFFPFLFFPFSMRPFLTLFEWIN